MSAEIVFGSVCGSIFALGGVAQCKLAPSVAVSPTVLRCIVVFSVCAIVVVPLIYLSFWHAILLIAFAFVVKETSAGMLEIMHQKEVFGVGAARSWDRVYPIASFGFAALGFSVAIWGVIS